MRGLKRVMLMLVLLTASAWSASAQIGASLSGVVKDASGAVLPGVTVEAASRALLQDQRAVRFLTGFDRVIG